MSSPFSHGANVNGLVVSSISISMTLNTSATWYSVERWYLWYGRNFLIHSVNLRSGLRTRSPSTYSRPAADSGAV
ncbi:hypothetical protein PENSUB_13114 [Penicillium subrubescens]|uniref:Uncharacterized protein n=1 Tax=Penicillium subrubescens TaxID=1316194 RepID=A0A1Q5STC1_9EURO|nr:hypothetical protein PENSUB_13114 [Penicillium subrubescens]